MGEVFAPYLPPEHPVNYKPQFYQEQEEEESQQKKSTTMSGYNNYQRGGNSNGGYGRGGGGGGGYYGGRGGGRGGGNGNNNYAPYQRNDDGGGLQKKQPVDDNCPACGEHVAWFHSVKQTCANGKPNPSYNKYFWKCKQCDITYVSSKEPYPGAAAERYNGTNNAPAPQQSPWAYQQKGFSANTGNDQDQQQQQANETAIIPDEPDLHTMMSVMEDESRGVVAQRSLSSEVAALSAIITRMETEATLTSKTVAAINFQMGAIGTKLDQILKALPKPTDSIISL